MDSSRNIPDVQIDLRERYGNVVLNKFPVNYFPDLTLYLLDPEYIITEE